MACFSRFFNLIMLAVMTCVIDLDLSESTISPAFVSPHISLSHRLWLTRRANLPTLSASRCRLRVGSYSLTMSRSQESNEIVFVPGQTPKSQPRRGSGSKWEQWFGALDEKPADGRIDSEANASSSASADDADAASIKAGDNLKRLQSATHNSLDWKVRTRLRVMW